MAGVIGCTKFAYDLWGDAVNTASRMESHGVGGQVQITQTTYELIKNDFVCEPGGVVNVKGQGRNGSLAGKKYKGIEQDPYFGCIFQH